jgi:hypothetical protein
MKGVPEYGAERSGGRGGVKRQRQYIGCGGRELW